MQIIKFIEIEEGGTVKLSTFAKTEIPEHNTCGILRFHQQFFEENSKTSNNNFLL